MSLTERPSQVSNGPVADSDDLRSLLKIVEGTAAAVGDDFFSSLVFHLAEAMGTGYAFVAELAGEGRARTLAYRTPDGVEPAVEWDVTGTPCEDVVNGNLSHHPSGVGEKFPHDQVMLRWGIESYLGVPLTAPDGRHLGHLCVFRHQAHAA